MSEKKGKRKRQPSKSKEGLFDDLESLSDLEIEERTSSLNASMQATEQELKRVEQERGVEITLVQSLRTIQESTRGISKERTSVLNEFRNIRGKAQAIRQKRDAINENVPPPLEIIEQRLAQTHLRLATIPNDLSKMPNRDHEVKLFSFFFELQAMHARKTHGNELHQKYIELLRNQDEKLKQLDKLSEERKSIAEEAREEIPDQKANPKEIRNLNERIAGMLEDINIQKTALKKMRREVGRLKAYARIRKKAQKGARGGRTIGPRLDEVKARASSGGALTLEDLGALLNSGGLEALSDAEQSEDEAAPAPEKQKRRKVGAARGRRRSLNAEEKEKRRR